MNNSIIKGETKNWQIQFIRGLCCLLIVFFHYTVRYSQIYNVDSVLNNDLVGYFSSVGVMTFFVISGFYIFRRKSCNDFKSKVIYWLKRLLIIYSLYLISIIIIYMLSFTGLYGNDRTVSIQVFLQNILFINVFTRSPYVDGAHWYIFALFMLYILVIIYDLFLSKYSKSYLYWIFLLFISIIVLVVSNFIDNIFISILELLFCNKYFPCVFVGIAFYFLDYEKIKSKYNMVLFSCFIMIGIYYIFVNWIIFIILLFISIIVLLAILRKIIIFEKIKPIIIVGNSSFSIYLIHQNIGYLLINLFNKIINYYFSFILSYFLILIIGFLYYIIIEKNMRRIIDFILKKCNF